MELVSSNKKEAEVLVAPSNPKQAWPWARNLSIVMPAKAGIQLLKKILAAQTRCTGYQPTLV
jgi:hypothetical protein